MANREPVPELPDALADELTDALSDALPDAPDEAHGTDGGSAMDIIATVSHELRSPLTSIKGYTSLLLNRWDRLDDGQKQEMLGQVQRDADRVTRLITELLDISRLATGQLHLRREMVSLPDLASAVVATVAMTYPELTAELDFPADFPEVWVDCDKILQVLTNLVENAAKYAEPAGLRIIGTVTDHHVVVSVHDRGAGIPEADLPRVFQRFFQRDLGRPSGTGLGLWISRGLVEAHDGRLSATSIEGEGSTFTFTLPLGAFEALHGTTAPA